MTESKAKDGEGAEALLAQIDLMRKALEPMRRAHDQRPYINDSHPDYDLEPIEGTASASEITFGDLRRASESLAPPTPPARGPTGVWRNPEDGAERVLVPREPSFEMISRGGAAIWDTASEDRHSRIANAYRAMLSASPPLLVGDEDSGSAVSQIAPASKGADTEAEPSAADNYHRRVHRWIIACFGEEIAADGIERNHRFLEESLELVQSLGCTQSEAHQLVDYVFGRELGEPGQEVGGVMNTLAALCNAHCLDMDREAEAELARVWTKVEQIRAKQAAKPKHSPLPEAPR